MISKEWTSEKLTNVLFGLELRGENCEGAKSDLLPSCSDPLGFLESPHLYQCISSQIVQSVLINSMPFLNSEKPQGCRCSSPGHVICSLSLVKIPQKTCTLFVLPVQQSSLP